MPSMHESKLHLNIHGIVITVKIISPFNRKHRRAILLMLFRAVKVTVRELKLFRLYHSDEPFGTTISTMIRGVVGNDALLRTTPEEDVGYLVRILRTKCGYTQEEFAKFIGASQAYVSRVEHGERRINGNLKRQLDFLVNAEAPLSAQNTSGRLQTPKNIH